MLQLRAYDSSMIIDKCEKVIQLNRRLEKFFMCSGTQSQPCRVGLDFIDTVEDNRTFPSEIENYVWNIKPKIAMNDRIELIN